jgi:ornithine cyclodeaminase/alanine dehydrogenase-like protein (mu-crystallin family)
MSGRSSGSLRYLAAADVIAALPPIEERLALAERTLVALVSDAELPPKFGVHPRPAASFSHAMPALLRGEAEDGSDDLLGMKWVVGFPSNVGQTAADGTALPAISATVILNDAATGLPRAVIDAGPITAHRTAAVTGVAIRRWGAAAPGPGTTVAIIGAGVQARSHLPVIGHLLPGVDLALCDRDEARVEALAADARSGALSEVPFGDVRFGSDPNATVEGADLVITLASFGPDHGIVDPVAFGHDTTIVAVDYDVCVPAVIADRAVLFLTDDRGQFLATRTGATFMGYPDPDAMIGEAIRDGTPRPEGQVLVTHLGVGLADVVFGDAVLRAAEARGLGTPLPG